MDCLLTEKKTLSDRYVLMVFRSPDNLPEIYPGQFAQVRIDNSTSTFLRRPISICMKNGQNEFWLLVRIAGEGTKNLVLTETGASVNMILPLGKPFSIPGEEDNSLLVGGGVGVAPMLMLGKQLHELKRKVSFLLGARISSELLLIEEFSKYGNVYLTTEDGSKGEKGFVTEHSILQKEKFDHVYACGPKPMMISVAKYAEMVGADCEVSLENMMACGIGACLCCVENTVKGNVCVCKEGPVFNTKMLRW